MKFPITRLRRLRQHPVLRHLMQETRVSIEDLIFPLFIKDMPQGKNPISAMPGLYQLSLQTLTEEIEELKQLGIYAIILFGIPAYKDEIGSASYQEEGIIQKAIQQIKKQCPEMLIICDCCLCDYTSHGHCGVFKTCSSNAIDNDLSLEIVEKQALSFVQAGADVIAPSGMLDGVISHLRTALDQKGYSHIPLLSYTVKYHSALYASFRFAVECAPSFGDRSSTQMDVANALEALREAQLDIEEGADMIMVKPAHAYLDVLYRIKQAYPQIPLVAYHTSAEFSMIKAAALNNWIDEKKVATEILTAIKRSGADCIITYYAKEIAKWQKSL